MRGRTKVEAWLLVGDVKDVFAFWGGRGVGDLGNIFIIVFFFNLGASSFNRSVIYFLRSCY